MWPGSSVSGLYLAHPDAHYFGVAKVERDQVEDYAARKKMAVADVERWLAPILNYDAAAKAGGGVEALTRRGGASMKRTPWTVRSAEAFGRTRLSKSFFMAGFSA